MLGTRAICADLIASLTDTDAFPTTHASSSPWTSGACRGTSLARKIAGNLKGIAKNARRRTLLNISWCKRLSYLSGADLPAHCIN